MGRPIGVTILGIFYILGGISWIFLAIVIGSISTGFMGTILSGLAGLGGILSGVVTIAAVIEFVIAGALFSGKRWGRIIVIIFAIIDLMVEAVSLLAGNIFGIVFIILDLIVLYYMWRPHVIEYFKGSSGHNTCIYCGYLAESKRELHNHKINCEKREQHGEE